MKKIIVLALTTIIVLTAALVAGVVYKLNDLVYALQPQIERRISEVIGAPVSLGKISLALFPALQLTISDAKVATSNTAMPAPLTLLSLKAALKLKPLLNKKLDITSIEIEAPKFATIRDSRGVSIYGLDLSSSAKSPSSAGPISSSINPNPNHADPINISVSRILVSKGDITYRDFVNLSAYSFKAIKVDATTSYQSDTITIPEATLSLSIANDRHMRGTPIPITLSGSSISFAPNSGKLVLPHVTADSDLGAVILSGAINTRALHGNLSISSKAIDIQKALSAAKTIAQVTAPTTPTGSIATDLAVEIKGPESVSIRGPITISNVNIPLQAEQSITGLNGTFAINGNNKALEIRSDIGEFSAKGINIPNLILSKISNIPSLDGALRSQVAPEYQKYFDTPDTRIKSIKAECIFKQNFIELRSLVMTSDAFTLETSGAIPLDSDMKLSTILTLNSEISATLAKRSKTVAAFLDSNNLLSIPVIITGRAPGIIATPDMSKLLQGAAGKLIEEHAGAPLRDALGGNTAKKLSKSPIGKMLGF